jgi:small-conductance mechanosensitive channel
VVEFHRSVQSSLRNYELESAQGLADPAVEGPASALHAAYKQRAFAYERVARAGTQLERQLSRWLDDLGFSGASAGSDDWKLVAQQARQWLKRVWEYELFFVDETTPVDGKLVSVSYGVTVGKSIGAIVLFIVGYWLLSHLSQHALRVAAKRFGIEEQLASVLRRWLVIGLALLLLIFVLNLARIPLTVFAFFGGALVIGVGFGTQTIIKNLISGIIILFERKIRLGDIIELNGVPGYVTAVDLRATTIRGFNGIESMVPNSDFLENPVTNWTYSNARVRREIKVGVAYGSPVRRVTELIAACAVRQPEVLKTPAPEVFFEDFGDSALAMSLVFWVEMTPSLSGRRLDSDIRIAIDDTLAEAGIAIPFPQREVRLIGAVPA